MEDLRTKYRPTTLQQVWGNDVIKKLIMGYKKTKHFPKAFILAGDYGTGKTTLAKILGEEIISCYHSSDDCVIGKRFEEHNATDPDIAKTIESICSLSLSLHGVTVQFLDEAHRIRDNIQERFLKLIENPHKMFFIFATKEVDSIDEGLQTRCTIFRMKLPTKDCLCKELAQIAKNEGITIRQEAIEYLIQHVKYNPRKALGQLQGLIGVDEEIDSRFLREMWGFEDDD